MIFKVYTGFNNKECVLYQYDIDTYSLELCNERESLIGQGIQNKKPTTGVVFPHAFFSKHRKELPMELSPYTCVGLCDKFVDSIREDRSYDNIVERFKDLQYSIGDYLSDVNPLLEKVDYDMETIRGGKDSFSDKRKTFNMDLKMTLEIIDDDMRMCRDIETKYVVISYSIG